MITYKILRTIYLVTGKHQKYYEIAVSGQPWLSN